MMDIHIDPERLRLEVRQWLTEHWRGLDDREWREKVVLAGWSAPTLPKNAFGHGITMQLARVVRSEFDAVGASWSCREFEPDRAAVWVRIAGMTVARHGSAELIERFIRDLLTGDADAGVALYSEPNAGSDLASLQTRAVLEGDHWVITGQKVWSSRAVEADFGLLLARTDVDVPKHQGISYFILPMRQPGIEIRPIRKITGDFGFNEVFMTNVKAPLGNLVGDPGDGWRVLQTALAVERDWLGDYWDESRRPDLTPSREDEDPHLTRVMGATDLINAARNAGKAEDPAVRQTIAQLYSWRMVNQWTVQRMSTGNEGAGLATPVWAAALGKLATSRILHSVSRFKAQMLGPAAMLYGDSNPTPDAVNREIMNAFINSVGGGSDQIQRNIISERLLGLPKGYEPDRGIPFRDITKNTTQRATS